MRKHLLVAAVVVVLTLVGSAAFAQSPVTRVSVPFQFIVGETMLPAGSYVVTNVLEGSSTLSVRSEDGKAGAMVIVDLADKPGARTGTSFVFTKVGGQCFLSSVSAPGMKTQVIRLPKDRVEAVLARVNGARAPLGGSPTSR